MRPERHECMDRHLYAHKGLRNFVYVYFFLTYSGKIVTIPIQLVVVEETRVPGKTTALPHVTYNILTPFKPNSNPDTGEKRTVRSHWQRCRPINYRGRTYNNILLLKINLNKQFYLLFNTFSTNDFSIKVSLSSYEVIALFWSVRKGIYALCWERKRSRFQAASDSVCCRILHLAYFVSMQNPSMNQILTL